MPELTPRPTRGRALRGLLATSGAVAAAIVLAVSLSGASLALWTDNDAAHAGTVTSGTVSLSITGTLNSALWSNLIPGESVRQSVTVTNTGSVPLALQGSATRANSAVEVRLASGACPAVALTSAQATVTPTALGTLAASASTTVCIEARLASAAAIGASSTFSVTVSGTQV